MSPDNPSEETVSQTAPRRRRPAARRLTVVALLVLPVAALLAIPIYDRVEPRVGGVPFFYWYQFACLLLAVLCLGAALGVRDRQSSPRQDADQW